MNMSFIKEVAGLSGLMDEDRRLLTEMKPALEKHAQNIVAAFYENLEQNEHLHQILHSEPDRIERLKGHLRRWLVSLAENAPDEEYFEDRYRIGHRHVEVGLEPRYVIAAMAWCRATVAETIVEAEYADDAHKEDRCAALNKAMDLDLNIMLQSYDDKRVDQFLQVTGFSKQLFENMLSEEV